MIKYLKTVAEIPPFSLPHYDGQRYEAMVPDTLDLQERSGLALHCMTEAVDPEADYEMYFWVDLRSAPPRMRHNWSDQCQPKFCEAVPLMRIASGSPLNTQVERRWMEVALQSLGPDGVAYSPHIGRPWIKEPNMDNMSPGDFTVDPIYNGRLASAMSLYAMLDPGGPWKAAVQKLVDGIKEYAVDEGSYMYFYPSGWRAEKVKPTGRPLAYDNEIRMVSQGMVHALRMSGYEPAREIAEKIHNYFMLYFFEEDGTFLSCSQHGKSKKDVHFHSHTADLLSILDYGILTGDQRSLDFALKGYAYAKSEGEALSGYFPEHTGSKRICTSEICSVADMIALAVKFSQNGILDCWDDADRWTRNMLAEGQLIHTDWAQFMPEKPRYPFPESEAAAGLDAQRRNQYATVERVAERNVGAFAGFPTMNDWLAGFGPGIMHCCTGNASRTLYQVWESIFDYRRGRLKVNLLMNRASKWADMNSYIPYKGQVDIQVKMPLDLSLRAPEWVNPEEMRVTVNGLSRMCRAEGRYISVPSLNPGDLISVAFPIPLRTDTVDADKQRYRIVRKGNEIVYIDPPGQFAPIHMRPHYRSDVVRWKKIERFISETSIRW